MVIASLIKEKLSLTPAGVVLTTRDFGVEMRYQPALAKALNRLVHQGELQKIAKGKYYIPKKTIFGNLKPADSELVKDFLEQNGKIVGYITGTAAFASLGLTTQISSSILVGTNKYRRPITRNGVKISFLLQENAITSSNIPLLRILDALRIKRVQHNLGDLGSNHSHIPQLLLCAKLRVHNIVLRTLGGLETIPELIRILKPIRLYISRKEQFTNLL